MLLICPLEAFWKGLKLRNPPPGSLPAVGSKLCLALLAVSPGARSDRSLHNSGLRRSRNGRRRRGVHSLRGKGQHASEDTTAFRYSKEKVRFAFANVPKSGHFEHISGRIKYQAGTGQPGFRFLQFRNVQRLDVKPFRFKDGLRLRKGRRKNHGTTHR
jgi:hypothetical protein